MEGGGGGGGGAKKNTNHHGVLGGDLGLAVAQQALDKLGDVSAGNGDVLDRAANDVALGHRDHVRDAIARVDHCARQGAVLDILCVNEGEFGFRPCARGRWSED